MASVELSRLLQEGLDVCSAVSSRTGGPDAVTAARSFPEDAWEYPALLSDASPAVRCAAALLKAEAVIPAALLDSSACAQSPALGAIATQVAAALKLFVQQRLHLSPVATVAGPGVPTTTSLGRKVMQEDRARFLSENGGSDADDAGAPSLTSRRQRSAVDGSIASSVQVPDPLGSSVVFESVVALPALLQNLEAEMASVTRLQSFAHTDRSAPSVGAKGASGTFVGAGSMGIARASVGGPTKHFTHAPAHVPPEVQRAKVTELAAQDLDGFLTRLVSMLRAVAVEAAHLCLMGAGTLDNITAHNPEALQADEAARRLAVDVLHVAGEPGSLANPTPGGLSDLLQLPKAAQQLLTGNDRAIAAATAATGCVLADDGNRAWWYRHFGPEQFSADVEDVAAAILADVPHLVPRDIACEAAATLVSRCLDLHQDGQVEVVAFGLFQIPILDALRSVHGKMCHVKAAVKSVEDNSPSAVVVRKAQLRGAGGFPSPGGGAGGSPDRCYHCARKEAQLQLLRRDNQELQHRVARLEASIAEHRGFNTDRPRGTHDIHGRRIKAADRDRDAIPPSPAAAHFAAELAAPSKSQHGSAAVHGASARGHGHRPFDRRQEAAAAQMESDRLRVRVFDREMTKVHDARTAAIGADDTALYASPRSMNARPLEQNSSLRRPTSPTRFTAGVDTNHGGALSGNAAVSPMTSLRGVGFHAANNLGFTSHDQGRAQQGQTQGTPRDLSADFLDDFAPDDSAFVAGSGAPQYSVDDALSPAVKRRTDLSRYLRPGGPGAVELGTPRGLQHEDDL